MKHSIEKMRICLHLLPPPGGEVVAECLDEIESLRQQLADLHASKTRQLQAVNPFYKENEE